MTQLNNALVKHVGGESGPGVFFRTPVSIPAVDVSETGEAYILYMDMPGAQKDAISVTVVDETLAVKAPVAPIHVEGAAVLYREIRTGGYERRFTLGQGIDRNDVDARYENGVLIITLPKVGEAKPQQIEIKVK
jgi:HSP20 family protein